MTMDVSSTFLASSADIFCWNDRSWQCTGNGDQVKNYPSSNKIRDYNDTDDVLISSSAGSDNGSSTDAGRLIKRKCRNSQISAPTKLLRLNGDNNEALMKQENQQQASFDPITFITISPSSWNEDSPPFDVINVNDVISSFDGTQNSNFISEELMNFTLDAFKQETPSSVVNVNECTMQPYCSKKITASDELRNSAFEQTEQSTVMNSTSFASVSSSSADYFDSYNVETIERTATAKVDYAPISSVSIVTSDNSLDEYRRNTNIHRFQYVLCAATSMAMKANEESLTYLNQGQPYEIKLKKLGDLTSCKGKIFKSVIRVLFHDRRLRYSEREQMNSWQLSRPGDRLLEIDKPLSYGLLDCMEDPAHTNSVQFLWNPTKEVGVFIKVNCISTEFTVRKHGGEKGVSFRLQIETFIQNKPLCTSHTESYSLHTASCQIKVFKLKGADRKHKQDREKIMKKSPAERDNYQQSYECTVFSETWLSEPLPFSSVNNSVISLAPNMISETDEPTNSNTNNLEREKISKNEFTEQSHTECVSTAANNNMIVITKDSSKADIQEWLKSNRFSSYVYLFDNFTAKDIFNLSKDDLINLCGLPDGIRLFNALPMFPRLLLYISVEDNSNEYYPIYLKTLSCQELMSNVAPLLELHVSQVHSIYILGPRGCKIIVTDNFVQNIKDETFFSLKMLPDICKNQSKKLLMKPITVPSINVIPTPPQSV